MLNLIRNFLIRHTQVRQMRDLMPLRQHAEPRVGANEPADSPLAGGLGFADVCGVVALALAIVALLIAMDVIP